MGGSICGGWTLLSTLVLILTLSLTLTLVLALLSSQMPPLARSLGVWPFVVASHSVETSSKMIFPA
jgi:hypothetical protein